MEIKKNFYSKSARAFTNGSLVVLGIFVVLAYGLAALVLFHCTETSKLQCLVWILVISTPIFLCIGFVLVAWLHKKYYIDGQIELFSKTQNQCLAYVLKDMINSIIDEKLKTPKFKDMIKSIIDEKLNTTSTPQNQNEDKNA